MNAPAWLEEERQRIDAVDEALGVILRVRARLVAGVASRKAAEGMPRTDAEREDRVLARYAALPGLDPAAAAAVGREVLRACKVSADNQRGT